MADKTYTVAEVMELQNQEKQLISRLVVHKNRSDEKKKELQELFKTAGVSNIQELSKVCSDLNNQMQQYAARVEGRIAEMKVHCEQLDSML